MTRFQHLDIQLFDVRCPECSRFVKVDGVLVDVFTDSIVEVLATCKRHGAVKPVQYSVWP